MEITIKLRSLIGVEVRMRSSAKIIYEKLNHNDNFIIDLSDISFISRSFADELCEIIEQNNNVSIINATGIAKNMLDVVKESRGHKRIYQKENSEILKMDSITELSAYLKTF